MKSSPTYTLVFTAILCLGLIFFMYRVFSSSNFAHSSSFLLIRAPLGTIQSLVATSTVDQERGLGDRPSLPAEEGMLFTFARPGVYGFWMKDMRFPLDMVWIDKNKVVVGIAANVPADSYPSTFFPPRDILYVLELNAGGAGKYGIETGTRLMF